MALPVFQAAGASVNSGIALGNVSPAWPAHLTDDVALLVCETSNELVTLTDAQGFVEIPSSPQGVGTEGVTNATRLTIFWCRATSSSMTAPTIQEPPTNHLYARIITFRGCVNTGNPWDVTVGDTLGGTTSTVITIPGATTGSINCLVVALCACQTDNTAAQASGQANADLTSVTEIIDNGTNTGNGGGISAITGGKAAAGAYGSTSGTLNSASFQGRISIALASVVPVQAFTVNDAPACFVALQPSFVSTTNFVPTLAVAAWVGLRPTITNPGSSGLALRSNAYCF